MLIKPGIEIPAEELRWRFSRSSGPGGQSVNTTDSRVCLSFDLAATHALPESLRVRAVGRLRNRLVDGVITVHCEQERSQLRNRELAEARLAALLRDAVAPPSPPRRPTRPSRSAQQRRLNRKKQRSDTKRLRSNRADPGE